MDDLRRLRDAAVPRSPNVSEPLVHRLVQHTWQTWLLALAILFGLSWIAVVVGSIVGLGIILGMRIYTMTGLEVWLWSMGITVALTWLLFLTVWWPRTINGRRAIVRQVILEGDLFAPHSTESRNTHTMWGKATVEHKITIERDGAWFTVVSPIATEAVLHRLGTPQALVFDAAGTAHACRVYPIHPQG